jgi:hypothetical protein
VVLEAAVGDRGRCSKTASNSLRGMNGGMVEWGRISIK